MAHKLQLIETRKEQRVDHIEEILAVYSLSTDLSTGVLQLSWYNMSSHRQEVKEIS